MKQLFAILLLCMYAGAAFGQGDVRTRGAGGDQAAPTAQTRRITGRVLDAGGQPLLGATVSVVDRATNRVLSGTYTDANGNFTVDADPTANVVIRISYVGYANQEVAVTTTTNNLSITLQDEGSSLDEVVVVGYGTQTKRELTGAISKLEGSRISDIITPSFDQQLGGRIAGVQVSQTQGLLGSPAQIRIRGVNSLNSGTSPLIIIDGAQIFDGTSSGVAANNALSDINPNDIESYEVLKDGAATAIYGSRAANGVILITTKRGKAGKATVDIRSTVGWTESFRRVKLLNASEFVTIQNEKFANNSQGPQAFNPNNIETDWQEEIFQRGRVEEHNITIRGGSEATRFSFSFGYLQNAGFLRGNNQERISFSGTFDHKANKWLSVGGRLGLTNNVFTGLNVGANALGGAVAAAYILAPNTRSINPDGSYNLGPGNITVGNNDNLLQVGTGPFHPVWLVDHNRQRANGFRILPQLFAELTPIEGLVIRSQFASDVQLTDDYFFNHPGHGDGRGVQGNVFRQNSVNTRWTFSNTAQYSRTFAEDHNVRVLGGAEFQNDLSYSYFGQGQALSTPFFSDFISGTFTNQFSGGGYLVNGYTSYFGRLNYDYKKKYFFEASVREDAIVWLAPGKRNQVLYGVSGAWTISEEAFFKNASALQFVNFLKLRVSYALTGNQDLPRTFPYLDAYGGNLYGANTGFGYAVVGNPDLRWETNAKFNVGLDFRGWDDRVGVSVDYYDNKVDRLIQNVVYPLSFGIPNNSVTQNVGKLFNRGVEMTIDVHAIKSKDFNWNTTFTFAFNENQVTALNRNEDILNGTTNISRVGQPVGSLIGFNVLGVNAANGNLIYQLGNGLFVQANTGFNGGNLSFHVYDPTNPGAALSTATQVTAAANAALGYRSPSASLDRTQLWNTIPRFEGGWDNRFSYKGFELQIFLAYRFGNYIYNQAKVQSLRQDFQNHWSFATERWTTPGQVTNVPRFRTGTFDLVYLSGTSTLSNFVEDGWFIRAREITLRYNLPNSIVEKLKLSKLQVYAQVLNAFIITDYTGPDPENSTGLGNGGGGSNLLRGVDFNSVPLARTWVFGVNLSL